MVPIGDYCYCTQNLNEFRSVAFGGYWNSDMYAGGFYLSNTGRPNVNDCYRGGRLLYVPTATV